jgi:RNA polymerase sigma-70 factor (ECF subfamily)
MTAVAFARLELAVAASASVLGNQRSSDELLISRIADGNRIAMQVLFARYHVPIYRFALPIVRHVTMAEDLISDVFLDVWRQAAQFEPHATVSTWLPAVTKYKALNAEAAHRGTQLDCEQAASIEDSADNPEIGLQKKYSDEVLRQCVAALSP